MSRIRDRNVRALRRAGGWLKQLMDLVKQYGGYRAASGHSYTAQRSTARPSVGFKTQAKRKEILVLSFRRIRQLGYKIETVRNFREDHVRALVRHWEARGLSASTLQYRFSVLKLFAEEWLGKTGMLRELPAYLADPQRAKRQYAAAKDKSWTQNGVDIQAKIMEIGRKDPRGGMLVALIWAFGLRKHEAIMVRLRQAVAGNILTLVYTKGGRVREVPIDSDRKRRAIEQAMPFLTRDGHLGWPGKTLKQTYYRLDYLVRKVAGLNRKELGVTLHGLRHEYACDTLERHGVVPPVRGGDLNTQPKEIVEAATGAVMKQLGHARNNIGRAYYGDKRRPSHRRARPDPQ